MSLLDRRQFFRLHAAALAGAVVTPGALAARQTGAGSQAAASPEAPVASGFYRYALGDTQITVLSDGHFHFPMEILPDGMDPVEAQAFNVAAETREAFFRSRPIAGEHLPLQVSPVLVETGSHCLLVDSGWSGEGAPPDAGRLHASLRASGVPPAAIDTVVLTHAHPDHLGGILDPATGEPAFPDAEVVISDVELGFWTNGAAARAFEQREIDAPDMVAGIRAVLGAVEDRLRPIAGEAEVARNVRSIPSPGHTPGHICLGVEAGGRELLLTGDALTNVHTSFERPDWQIFVDVDREQAARTRRQLLDRATADDMLILGYHFPFPGLGHAVEYGPAYRWYPAEPTLLASAPG
jgi:glyoxylase-like metal-dependent hydrolase (beta-lactamase superfamily II)